MMEEGAILVDQQEGEGGVVAEVAVALDRHDLESGGSLRGYLNGLKLLDLIRPSCLLLRTYE